MARTCRRTEASSGLPCSIWARIFTTKSRLRTCRSGCCSRVYGTWLRGDGAVLADAELNRWVVESMLAVGGAEMDEAGDSAIKLPLLGSAGLDAILLDRSVVDSLCHQRVPTIMP